MYILPAFFLHLNIITAAEQATLATSKLWYAQILQERFPVSIPIHGSNYSINDLPCLPIDITTFDITTGTTSFIGVRAFQIQGAINLAAIPPPFKLYEGSSSHLIGLRKLVHRES